MQWVVLPVSILNFRAPRWNLALYGGSRWWHAWPPSALQDKVTRVLWDPFHQRLWTCAWSQASVSRRGFTVASIVVAAKAHNCPRTFLWSIHSCAFENGHHVDMGRDRWSYVKPQFNDTDGIVFRLVCSEKNMGNVFGLYFNLNFQHLLIFWWFNGDLLPNWWTSRDQVKCWHLAKLARLAAEPLHTHGLVADLMVTQVGTSWPRNEKTGKSQSKLDRTFERDDVFNPFRRLCSWMFVTFGSTAFFCDWCWHTISRWCVRGCGWCLV